MSSSNLGSIADQLDPDAHVAARHNSDNGAPKPCWACEHGDCGHCTIVGCYRCPRRHLHRRFGLSGCTGDLAKVKHHKVRRGRR